MIDRQRLARFLFPGFLAYAYCFASEADRAIARWAARPGLLAGARWAITALLALYLADTTILAVQLT